MATLEVGRVCMKTAGREAGRYAVVLKKIDINFVSITGPKSLTGVKRRRCNVEHLEPTEYLLNVKEDALDKTVIEEYKKSGVLNKLGLKLPGPESEEKPVGTEEKKPAKEVKAEKKEAKPVKKEPKREEIVPTEKEVKPVKKEVKAEKKEAKPVKKEVKVTKKETKPVKKEAKPKKEPARKTTKTKKAKK